MNANLTIDTLTFTQKYSDKAGSERREISRGVNLPEVLSIKHSDYVDSATKKAGVRTVLREDYYVSLSDGQICPVSAYLVVAVPTDINVTSAHVTSAISRVVSCLRTAAQGTGGLDLGNEIFVVGAQ